MAPHPWPAPPHQQRLSKPRVASKPEPITPERFRRWSNFSQDSLAASSRDAISCASSSLDRSALPWAKRKKRQFSPESMPPETPLCEPEPEVSLADYSGGMLALSPPSPKRCEGQSRAISPSEGTTLVAGEESSVTLEMPKVPLTDSASSWGCEWAEWAAQWQEFETSAPNSFHMSAEVVSPVQAMRPDGSVCTTATSPQADDSSRVSFRIGEDESSGAGTPSPTVQASFSFQDFPNECISEREFVAVSCQTESPNPASEVASSGGRRSGSEAVCIAVLGKDGLKTFYAAPEGHRKLAQERVQSLTSLRGDRTPRPPMEAIVATLEEPEPLACAPLSILSSSWLSTPNPVTPPLRTREAIQGLPGVASSVPYPSPAARTQLSHSRGRQTPQIASSISRKSCTPEVELSTPRAICGSIGNALSSSALVEPEMTSSLHDISFGPSSTSYTPEPSFLFLNSKSHALQRSAGATKAGASQRTPIVSPSLQARMVNTSHSCGIYSQAVATSRSPQRSTCSRARWQASAHKTFVDEVKLEQNVDSSIAGLLENETRPLLRRRCRTASPPAVAASSSKVFLPCAHPTPSPVLTQRNVLTPYQQSHMGWAHYGA